MATPTAEGSHTFGCQNLERRRQRGSISADGMENVRGGARTGETIASIDRAAGTLEPMI